jgi:hypothetical protein
MLCLWKYNLYNDKPQAAQSLHEWSIYFEYLHAIITAIKVNNKIIQKILNISITFAHQISFRAFWLASKSDAHFTSRLQNNAFQKRNNSANLVSKSTKCWKNSLQKTKELEGRIPLLFQYCVKFIFKDNDLKPRNIHFKQIAKTIPTVGKKPCRDVLFNPFCFVFGL